MNRKSIPTTDVAKLIRQTLKVEFPGIKFGVRSEKYSGGSSITIRWVNGPTEADVKPFVSMFAGATFDPMQDLKGYRDIVNEDGEHIHYGVDFVSCVRDYSDRFTMQVMEKVCAYWGIKPLKLNNFGWFDCPPEGQNLMGLEDITDLIRQTRNVLREDMTPQTERIPDWVKSVLERKDEPQSVTFTDTGVIISAEEIERWVSTTDPKDMTVEIRKGDFVILPRLSQSYQQAHVEYVNPNGSFTVTHGSMESSRHWRFGGTFNYTYTMKDVSEIWRQRRVARQQVVYFDGKEITCRTSDLEWYLVWADDRYQNNVNWWAA